MNEINKFIFKNKFVSKNVQNERKVDVGRITKICKIYCDRNLRGVPVGRYHSPIET